MPIKNVTLMLCTNDENGHDTGYATCVEMYHGDIEVLRLECCSYSLKNSIKCYLRRDKKYQFGRLRLNINSYRDWVGNWCWSAISLNYREAKRALQHLWNTGKFDFDSGLCKAADWWDGMAGRVVVKKPSHNSGYTAHCVRPTLQSNVA